MIVLFTTSRDYVIMVDIDYERSDNMIVIDKRSPEGNAHAVMGYVRQFLKETGRSDEWSGVLERMTSGDYDNLCAVAEEVTEGAVVVRDAEEDDE